MTSRQPTAALGEVTKHFCGPVAIVRRPQIVLRQGFSSNKNINLICCLALVPLLHLWPNFCCALFRDYYCIVRHCEGFRGRAWGKSFLKQTSQWALTRVVRMFPFVQEWLQTIYGVLYCGIYSYWQVDPIKVKRKHLF